MQHFQEILQWSEKFFSIDLLNYVDKALQAMSFQRQHTISQAYLSTNWQHENIYHLIFSKKIKTYYTLLVVCQDKYLCRHPIFSCFMFLDLVVMFEDD